MEMLISVECRNYTLIFNLRSLIIFYIWPSPVRYKNCSL